MSRGLMGSISTVTFCSAASWHAKLEVALVGAQPPRALLVVGALGQHAGHDVQARAVQRLRVAQRGDDARGELVLAAAERREAAVAGLVVAGRRVDQHDLELVLGHAGRDLARLVVVAEGELDGAKARVRGLAEAIEERNFVEQEGKIGGKARHEHGDERARRRAPLVALRRDGARGRLRSRRRSLRYARRDRNGRGNISRRNPERRYTPCSARTISLSNRPATPARRVRVART